MSLTLSERWDSALIVGRTPWSGCPLGPDALVPLLPKKNQALATIEKPARGPAADLGVRPTRKRVALCFSLSKRAKLAPAAVNSPANSPSADRR